MSLWKIFTLCLACAACATPAASQPVTSTRYEDYVISGTSAQEVYKAMLKRGPHVEGDKAYASTSAIWTQRGELVGGNSGCSVKSYNVAIDFVIRLPKLSKSSALPPADLKRFSGFRAFLKKHEETHREMWLGCAGDMLPRVRELTAENCDALSTRIKKMWTKMQKSCGVMHRDFDAREQKRLRQQPLFKYVTGQNTSASGAKVK